MKVLVDTCVWSQALRHKRPDKDTIQRLSDLVFALVAVVVLAGCDGRDLTVPPDDTLSAAARAELGLPSAGVLTLATEADMASISKLTPETVNAVREFLEPAGTEIAIVAARPVGSYLLLWISFPKIADGGIDLIWSVEKQEPVGEFLGGYRG